jgi:hypothetical protein
MPDVSLMNMSPGSGRGDTVAGESERRKKRAEVELRVDVRLR